MRTRALLTLLTLSLCWGCTKVGDLETPRRDTDMTPDTDITPDTDADPDQDSSPDLSAPTLENLPNMQTANVGESASFVIEADGDGGELSYAISSHDCAFTPALSETGVVTWQCTETTPACAVTVSVTGEGGLSSEGALTIVCVSDQPFFASMPPTEAREGEALSYMADCRKPDGDAGTVSIGADDTCGGALEEGSTYVATPTESMGGTTCLMSLRCEDDASASIQRSQISVEEVNQAPYWLNIDEVIEGGRRLSVSAQLEFADDDLPEQALSVSLVSKTCSFPVIVTPDGNMSFTCGVDLETCEAVVEVTDGEDQTRGTAQIGCTNQAPAVTNVRVTPEDPGSGDTLTCEYDFSDPNMDADGSLIQWIRSGNTQPVATGKTYTDYTPGFSYTCRVQPNDGLNTGVTQLSTNSVIIHKPVSVIAGERRTCAITHTGALRCWGDNTHGQMGNGARGGTVDRPTQVTGLTSGVTAVALGATESCAIHNGGLKCWGGSDNNFNTPQAISGASTDVTAISISQTSPPHRCYIRAGGLYCWGANSSGQAGGSSTPTRVAPGIVTGMNSDVISVATGARHTCAWQGASTKTLKCWGHGPSLGLGSSQQNSSTPLTVTTGLGGFGLGISAGLDNTCITNPTNAVPIGAPLLLTIKCWGRNSYGELGDGTFTNRFTPTTIPYSGNNLTINQLSVGSDFVCATTQDSFVQGFNMKLLCWGRGSDGRLGNSQTINRTNPAQVTGFTGGVTSVSAGSNHACAIHQDVIKCWGDNSAKQLGFYSAQLASSTTPVIVQRF